MQSKDTQTTVSSSTQQRILSGVQPTGNLHLGNYLGAIRQWVKLQDSYECLFMLADMHAVTVPQDPAKLRQHTRETAAAYIACGVNPEKAVIYPQSAVKQHAELAWILGCHTPLGWLNRMTQFKEKSGKNKDNAPLGLYSYPVLMAADILLYKATHVPVGEDQKQHLELARDIAGAFNRAYAPAVIPAKAGIHKEAEGNSTMDSSLRGNEDNSGYFPLPEPLILGEATRVMSLQDGTAKMSKSDPSEKSRITLTDDAETIRRKIMKAKADMDFEGIFYDKEKRPEISNLLSIYSAVSEVSLKEAEALFRNASNKEFKEAVAEAAVAHLSPITEKMRELSKDRAYLDKLLKRGAEKAETLAETTMKEVRNMVGFLRV